MNKLLLVLFAAASCATAQPITLDMKYFADRRSEFMAKMDSHSVAIFPCRPEYVRNGDVDYRYRQESNFYYLSGFEEPQSILVLATSSPHHRYILYVRKKDPAQEAWTGVRAGTEGAEQQFLADTALVYDDFDHTIYRFIRGARTLYYPFGINPQLDATIERMFSNTQWNIVNPFPILAEMRVIKNEGDWKMGLQKAIDISIDAHLAAMKAIHPEMYELEVQAVFESVYRSEGSPRDGYPCIIGSGPNATTLHYDENTRRMNDGELVLMDCAAEYGYYSADITRTVPVNGKFTKEQQTIYNIVLAAQDSAMSVVKPGAKFSDVGAAVVSVLSSSLLKLGFIKKKEDFSIFSFHGYSHWIGLEVHDVGSYAEHGGSRLLRPGMVFTIEPGVYVRPDVFDKMERDHGYSKDEIDRIRPIVEKYMNIGVRIEDDVLVTDDGHKNLTERAPRLAADVERAMHR